LRLRARVSNLTGSRAFNGRSIVEPNCSKHCAATSQCSRVAATSRRGEACKDAQSACRSMLGLHDCWFLFNNIWTRRCDGSAPFFALGEDPSLEAERLELGWMIANMARAEAVRMLQTIPGPHEAMAEANHFHREEERWRCWALWGANAPPKRARGR
jgi:hypothetical protein